MQKILIVLIVFFLATSCKKELHNLVMTQNSDTDSAIQYLQHTLSAERFQSLDITSLQTLYDQSRVIGIKVMQKNTKDNFVMIVSSATGYNGNWVDQSGIQITKHVASGTLNLKGLHDDWNTVLKVDSNNVTEIDNYSNSRLISQRLLSSTLNSRNATLQ